MLEYLERPVVTDDVVDREEEVVTIAGELHEPGAHQRPCTEIEGFPGLLVGDGECVDLSSALRQVLSGG